MCHASRYSPAWRSSGGATDKLANRQAEKNVQQPSTKLVSRTVSLTLGAALCAAGMVLCAAGTAAWAQDYPSRPIRLVIPYPPGGATDVTGRVLADKVSAAMGQPLVVENRPGAGSQVGIELAARAAPDGYTVLYTSNSVALLPYTNKSYALNVEKDLVPVAECCIAPLILAVPVALPARNIQELVAYFKANPGKVNFAASGVSDALAASAFANAAGFKFENIRYNGGAPATQALVAGDVQFVLLPLGTLKGMADGGRLRMLAVTSPSRYPGLPDVPTLAETVKPGFDASFWNGVYLPAGASAVAIARLNSAYNGALKQDDVRKKIAEYHMVPMVATPEQTRAAILADLVAFGDAARLAGVKPE